MTAKILHRLRYWFSPSYRRHVKAIQAVIRVNLYMEMFAMLSQPHANR